MRRIAAAFGGLVLLIVAFMVYMNVMAPDGEVLAKAEAVARTKVGCKDCTRTRVEGTSRIIDKKYAFTFDKAGSVTIVCRRAYIAIGDFSCTVK